MIHSMTLFERPFHSIKSGRKVVEVRLNDERRRKVKIGDVIEFAKLPDKKETIRAEVLELREYNTFEEMYEDIPFQDFDCESWTMEEMIEATYKIYTREQEQQWGTLAIKIKELA
ncbi:ASCH domain-containing protein [Paenibacillus aurantius]|uniref:ASCH domain-containing protein n=1 Tax=Paenibacillus aurantius TaxID=2918900 RepID=A0AA96REP7_9BACL|nr:ASCH domain-containing protein [Paenibacillus aurantius]WNQ11112.1 ASCH domain-containing protein [Paenibacillus aurantius]